MTFIQIFNQYLKRKLIFCWAIALIVTTFRYFTKGDITIQIIFIVLLISSLIGIIIGWQDYEFHEKKFPRTISLLLDQSPFKEISESNNFIKEEKNKLVGEINGYKIILSPLINDSGKKHLLILVPLDLRPGLDDFFKDGLDRNFKFHISDSILFTDAIFLDYEKEINYEKLLDILTSVTINLKEKMILPLKISND